MFYFKRVFLAGIASVALISTAQAQPANVAQPPLPPPPVSSPEPASSVPAGVLEDANSGRMWLSPTALMPPAGTWSFNDYELFFIGGSYAITDNFQVSALTLVPVSSGVLPFIITAKVGFPLSDRLHLAVQGTTGGAAGEEVDGFGGAFIGGVATLCLDVDCHSILNGQVTAGVSFGGDNEAIPLAASVGLVQRLTRRVKLVVEADTLSIVGDINETADGFLFWYGARFTSRNIGVDFGLAKPVVLDGDSDGDIDDDDDIFPLGFPWLNFTYRGLPL